MVPLVDHGKRWTSCFSGAVLKLPQLLDSFVDIFVSDERDCMCSNLVQHQAVLCGLPAIEHGNAK